MSSLTKKEFKAMFPDLAEFQRYIRHTRGCKYSRGASYSVACTCGLRKKLKDLDLENVVKEK